MEKNTILAIVLSSVIIIGGMTLIQLNAPDKPPETVERTKTVETESAQAAPVKSSEVTVTDEKSVETAVSESAPELIEQDYPVLTFIEETDQFKITFSTVGAVVLDIELIQELDEGEPISMVLDGGSGVGTFNMAFGGHDAEYITDVFSHEKIHRGKELIHRFSRDYIKEGQLFTLTKSYRIIPGEYVIELIVSLETSDGRAVPLLDGNEPAYTLTYGPQIGPTFEKIDGRYEIRDNVTWGPDTKSGKLKRILHKDKSKFVQSGNTVNWAAVVGKYFAVIVDPGSGSTTITWDGNPVEGQDQASLLQISKPARRQSVIEDTYKYYIGPLDRENLSRYDNAEDNAFGFSGMSLQKAPKTSAVLFWLEAILRWLLEFFYKLVPNYGVAIILLTILIKAVLFPFTHKSYESTSKMQAVQPKLKALQEQYKGDTKKIQQKTAELYKAEGVNPMGGCLPMLFQFPIFIALYGLLNKYFPLRGAVFITGWINDLSAPEYIWKFANPIDLKIWTLEAIRLLPVLYLAGQLLTTKVTQAGQTGAQSGAQQKMLTLGMPIMFFFILYNMPSGLLLYWTAMNFVTIGQQLVTNYVKKRKAAGGTA